MEGEIMTKKYEFTGVTKLLGSIVLHQIKRVSDGLIGGWIEKEENLSHKNSAWVYGNAQVSNPSQLICISGFPFHITITPQNAIIGCQLKTHKEWMKVTRKKLFQWDLKLVCIQCLKNYLK
jgi:hypothetical protein